MLTFGEVFAGISGFGAGFTQAGMECRWQIENDKDCNRVLERHYPNVKRYSDVKTVDPKELEPVDVYAAGFPCQDLSVAGKRAGLAGERSGLWFEFLRIIGLNRPRWIVIENVPGLLSSDEGRDFAVILRGLVECGYCLAWRIADAQFHGVAQRRRRVFIVGSLGDGSCAEILFESESVSWNPPTRREARSGVTPILEAGARTNGDGRRDGDGIGVEGYPTFTLQSGKQHAVAAPPQVTETLNAGAHPGSYNGQDAHANMLVTHALRSEGADASEDGTGRGTPIIAAPITSAFAKHHGRTAGNNGGADNLVVNCFNGYTGGPDDNDAQGNHLVTAWALHSQNSCAMTGHGDAQAAVEVDKARALDGGAGFTSSQGGNLIQQDAGPIAFDHCLQGSDRTFIHRKNGQAQIQASRPDAVAGGFGVRRLTPRECERLQGFPDDFTRWDANGKEISDSARYRMLGNAVCVNVARWIGKRILEAGI